ncbi:MAG: hypothetical protein J5939_04845, partial [Bacteroidales bacterium]|nr:hypothetical protein [Bacteroidales bacterium]
GDKIVNALGIKKLWVDMQVRSSKKRLLASARTEYEKGGARGTLADYEQALNKYWVTYQEYAYQYEFYKKSEEERNEYVSRLRMAYFYWRYAPGVAKAIFRNKTNFLKHFHDYIHRKWIYAPSATYEEFVSMINSFDCIIKPCDGKLGKGVSKVYKDRDRKDDKKLFEDCRKNRMLVEQCIKACDELSAFHPQSLNTIRVVTVANKEKACVFSGVLRTGVGDSVVDNSHAGGVSAQINIKNGIVESDGANTKGERFVCHPDSGIQFVGFKIPNWNQIVESVCMAAQSAGNPITGWDVVINSEGQVEFIEGNYGPDLDMMQARYNRGVKKEIYALIREYWGIELV